MMITAAELEKELSLLGAVKAGGVNVKNQKVYAMRLWSLRNQSGLRAPSRLLLCPLWVGRCTLKRRRPWDEVTENMPFVLLHLEWSALFYKHINIHVTSIQNTCIQYTVVGKILNPPRYVLSLS